MSYLVLARKHRPATFDQVVGQEHVTQTLAGALASDRLAHAFCFTGPRGVGKTSVARILAKAVNCLEGPTAEPCGKCVHCTEIDQGSAVDVQEIDAASNSRVEDVRELREMIRFRPQSARFRVTILDEVHMLSKAAFNALLKTLEEPPEHAVFILATTDVHKVPLTILSRCQRYDFRRLAPRVLVEHMTKVLAAENCALPPESLAMIAREADGSVRDSLSILDQVLSAGREGLSHQEVVELLGLVDRELVTATASAVLAGDAGAVLDLVSQVYAAGGEMQAFYAALQEHFRNLAAAKAAPPGMDLFGLTNEEIDGLREQARPISPETLHEIFGALAESEDLFRRASQPRLVMEMTLLKLTQVRPVLSLEEIIARLGGEEGGQATPPPRPSPGGNPAPNGAPTGGQRYVPPAGQAAPPRQAAPAPANQAPPQAQAAPRPAPGGGVPQAAAEALAQLARHVGKSEPLLSGALNRVQAAAWDGEALVLTISGGPNANRLTASETGPKLAGFCEELWGVAVPIRVSVSEAPPPRPPVNAEARAKAASELADHPVVKDSMEVFEADMVGLYPAEDN